MILNKFKSLLAILLLASTCLWAEPVGTSGKSSDDERSYWIDIALFFGSWVGTTTGDVNKYLDVRMGFPFIIDFELQLSRVAVGFYYGWGLIHSLPYLYDGVCFTEYDRSHEETDESLGLTLGYAVFNSRYVELQPFIGFGGNIFNNGNDDMDFSTFIMGGNVDFRFDSGYINAGEIGFNLGLMLRLKYIAEFGSFSDKYRDVKHENYYINHIFAISLGIAIMD
ncbi:hypothetical protein Fisuc_3061 [Fibrobacter succinogenes subsp. succinogenes S85]|jgi:hypothetical protein|uniref:Outer membrane protein beta-barrel domain-containing protein n=1 Tax=Fibrobacter succinogenes (strain ATCC 19169 / S85) TaxID=59374 RepID=A0ABN3Z1D7_FIBSS|nr:hypothetical protein [Fibrobacter succinogenes]ACX76641.1 hypothetical protein Fisuc_3061 [Fibrobacter succinogenes subsp. succinogenes S85]